VAPSGSDPVIGGGEDCANELAENRTKTAITIAILRSCFLFGGMFFAFLSFDFPTETSTTNFIRD
jgi:hypothetical protein